MKALLVFTFGMSLYDWHESGIIFRENAFYNEILKNKNVEYGFLTYGDQRDFNYANLVEGIHLFPISKYVNSKNFLLKFIKSIFLPFRLKKLFVNFDIIKAFQTYGSWVSFIAKILYGKKLIIRSGFIMLRATKNVFKRNNLRSYIKYLMRYSFIFLFELFAYKMADGIIVTSDYDIPFLIKYYRLNKKYKKNRIRLIYNYIDESVFKPLAITKKDKHIIYIGNLRRGKNVINLVKAFIGLKDFHLDIIGEGEDREEMEKIAKKHNININFLGLFPNKELPQILNQYQIFILPSIDEGNPKVLLEAMSCGIACIGTNIQGINNIINHKKNGYLCETNPESMREAIVKVYGDKNLRISMANQAREFILDNCSFRTIIEKEYSFYNEILNK